MAEARRRCIPAHHDLEMARRRFSGDARNARAHTLARRGLAAAKKAAKKAAAKERARQVRLAKRKARAEALQAINVQMTASGSLAVALT